MKNSISERMVGSALRADRNRSSTQFPVLRGLWTAMERRPYRLVWLVGLLSFSLFANTPPEITNVRASQRENTKLVDIYYDAADADGDLLKVRIEISDNDGLKYSVPAFSLTGDIGEGIAAGTNKHIVWDAGTDWDGEYSDKMRVKVYAIDAQGFPGLEWGNEVPPGGFLMGQDGGAEGSGPSRHVNIPWSYWLSKYEITAEQYCEFLNAAVVSGFVSRNGTTEVDTVPGVLPGINSTYCVISIGDNQCIRWNVNNFEVVGANTNKPVLASWYGALSFARYYGYDLPTEAEWEKAARGPDHDDQDEHTVYPWGNELTSSCANYYSSGDPYNNGRTPVGYYNGNQTPMGNDMINGYGLYDVVGNVSEWTRSIYSSNYPIESYPNTEDLDEYRNRALSDDYAVCKGGGYGNNGSELKLFYRSYGSRDYSTGNGFRVIRRGTNDISRAKCCGVIDCENLSIGNVEDLTTAFGLFSVTNGTVNCISESSDSYTNKCMNVSASTAHLVIQLKRGRLRYVKFRMNQSNANGGYVKLVSVLSDGTTSWNRTTATPGNAWCSRSLMARGDAVGCYLEIWSSNSSYPTKVDDIEFYMTDN